MAPATYLVGGAVRDSLLGLPAGERDWVVVGSTPEAMRKAGYRQVGASFPVFIHPETGDEYALARTERKQGHGYHGFTVDFHPGVTLEEDLERRDLTINAMAKGDDGALHDPFGGRADLEARWLRHVSPAFVEDPLRVLRVARFAARFAPLGFRVHPDTQVLMREIVDTGEMEHLVPERAWTELIRALGEPVPSQFVAVLRGCGALARWLPEVDALFGVPQAPEHHPEVDTGEHLLLALDAAAGLGASFEAVFAVLLHDLGKALTDPQDWPRHLGHEATGAPLVEAVCARLKAPVAATELALKVCREHLRCHRALELRPGKVMALLEAIDALRKPDVLEPFLAACEADWRGRKGRAERPYPQAERLRAALAAVRAIHARDLDTEGLEGAEIGATLRAARIAAIAELPVDPAE